jgi:hypothetical protein
MSRSNCADCLLRHILYSNQIKNGVVNFRAFKGGDENGISLTETRDVIVKQIDLDEYVEVVSERQTVLLGVAVMDAMELSQAGLTWQSDPHDFHCYGYLHVLGPKGHELSDDLRKECARIATMSQWSRSPRPK